MDKKNFVKAVAYLLGAIGTALLIMFGLQSCNVTRTVTTTNSYYQKGDTSVVMQSRTIESYDATKR